MEYVIYLAAILVPLGLCCYKVRELGRAAFPGRAWRAIGREDEIPEIANDKDATGSLRQAEQVRQRELLKVPTPWGWPGNPKKHETQYIQAQGGKPAPGSSEGPATLHRWVDHLVSSKQTTDNREYLRRRESSMRALLEDRFVSPKQMTKIEYQKTKPLLLRDPSEPHDQMDNFPAGRIDKIESRLRTSSYAGVERSKKIESIVYEEAPALVSPWGW